MKQTGSADSGHILIVDDSINNIDMLSDILIEDYEIQFATSGSKAIEIAKEFSPDLILLDIVMPEMDGYEIIDRLRSEPATDHIPVIFITAKSSTEDMIEGFKWGAADYISKPFAAEEVKVRVKTQIENQFLIKALTKANKKLEALTRVDGLTGIANRRYFDEFLQQMINRARRIQSPLSLILIDVDYFKLYNDNYGHQQGDICLQQVATELDKFAQREGELVARYGGEEFAIVIFGLSKQEIQKRAQLCLNAIEDLKIEHETSHCESHVTISAGQVTLTDSNQMNLENFIRYADEALYKAKEQGRNQLQIYQSHAHNV